MEADDSPQSLKAVKTLENTGDSMLDLSLDGPRVWPFFSESRSNQSYEEHYHSFVGKVACGRWAINDVENTCEEKHFTGFAITSQ